MKNKTYGAKKLSYKVSEKNGWITLYVCHKNKEVRKYLNIHKNDPKYYLERQDQYRRNNLTSKKLFAQVIYDYRIYFERDRVKFVFK